MAAVVDVGDAFELTFASVPNATVSLMWLDPGGVAVLEAQDIDESAPGSGLYQVTLVTTAAGMWQAIFTASGAVTAVESYYVRSRDVTGPAPLAAIGDVTGQFGQLTAAQEGTTSFLIRAASAMVRHAFPYVDLRLASGRLNPDLVALAVANMVLRVLRNPNGLKAETVGPFSRTYDTGLAAGLLVITATDAGMLTPAPVVVAAGGVGGIGTIRVRPGLMPPRRPRGSLWWPDGRY